MADLAAAVGRRGLKKDCPEVAAEALGGGEGEGEGVRGSGKRVGGSQTPGQHPSWALVSQYTSEPEH